MIELTDTIDEVAYELHLAKLAKPTRSAGVVKQGNSNKRAVRALQERLTALGFATENDGVFGDDTIKQVKAFQKSRGALIDGKVGEETLGKLLRATPGQPDPTDPSIDALVKTVEPGAPQPAKLTRGLGDIKAIQEGGGTAAVQKAQERGFETPKGAHGGNLDPVTGKERATATTGPIGSTKVDTPSNMSFEDAHPRGQAGSSSGGKFVKKGDSGGQTRNVQRRVNQAMPRKNKKLKVDGEFGAVTDARVKMFQAQQGLTTDGVVGPKTLGALVRATRRRKRS